MRIVLASLVLLLAADAAEAQKTDSVWIQNGDHITGEVKSLSRALLEYSTDDLGTIYIERDNVERITSPATFEVQLTSGKKFYGPLGLAPDGLVVVEADTLPLREIVEIAPIKGSLLARLSVLRFGVLLPEGTRDASAHDRHQSDVPWHSGRDHIRV